jgi:cytochrome c oxidase cbb3-type subunit 1
MSTEEHPIHDEGLSLAERAAIDDVGRPVVLLAFISAIVWLLIGSLAGDIVSLKFNFPDWLSSAGWLTFGRWRPVHLNGINYGWGSLAMIGTALWLMPRLLHVPLQAKGLSMAGVILWNAGLAIGCSLLLAGWTNGIEWLEMDRWLSAPFQVIGGGLIALSMFLTVARRQVSHMYISVLYTMLAFVAFPIIYVTGQLPIYKGVEHAAVNWFYGHNALGYWMTPLALAAIYYFIPKVLGRPIYSYQLSLIGFWAFSFFYAFNGMHHLIAGPLPSWMIATSIVASALMVIPVLAVGVNHHMTVVGRFASLRYSPTLRFIVLGAMAYTAVSLQGSFTALMKINRITHFTQWTIAHSHTGAYGFVTMAMFGSMYYILPRLTKQEWPSDKLIRWHFWLSLTGITLYVVALSVGGVLQGLAMNDPAQPFSNSVVVTVPYLWARSLAGLMLTGGHVIFAYHVAWILGALPIARRMLPPWHEPSPIIIQPGDGPTRGTGA